MCSMLAHWWKCQDLQIPGHKDHPIARYVHRLQHGIVRLVVFAHLSAENCFCLHFSSIGWHMLLRPCDSMGAQLYAQRLCLCVQVPVARSHLQIRIRHAVDCMPVWRALRIIFRIRVVSAKQQWTLRVLAFHHNIVAVVPGASLPFAARPQHRSPSEQACCWPIVLRLYLIGALAVNAHLHGAAPVTRMQTTSRI
jgi:hypothetical protein